LKKRFKVLSVHVRFLEICQILRVPMLFHEKSTVDAIFLTCAVLHNMILVYDGRTEWENDENAYFTSPPADATHDEEEAHEQAEAKEVMGIDLGGIANCMLEADDVVLHEDTFFDLRRALVQHVRVLKATGSQEWLNWR
jgi:hypothetical protein